MNKDKDKIVKLILAIMLLISSSTIYAEDSVSFSVLSGSKALTNDWGLFESQTESGFIVELQAPEWPVALVPSIFSSKKSISVPDVKVTGSTMEVGGRCKKVFNKKTCGFFYGGWIGMDFCRSRT